MNNELGKRNNSQKKIKEEINKKIVKKGPKSNVVKMLTIEIGNPQLIRKGREIRDINNCNNKLLSNDKRHFVNLL